MTTEAPTLTNAPGQLPVEVRFGQLEAGASGFRFRIASGDAELCYPDLSGG